MRNVAITLKSSTNEERSYQPQVFQIVPITLKPSKMRNVAITLKYATNEERSYLPQVFDK